MLIELYEFVYEAAYLKGFSTNLLLREIITVKLSWIDYQYQTFNKTGMYHPPFLKDRPGDYGLLAFSQLTTSINAQYQKLKPLFFYCYKNSTLRQFWCN